MLERNSKRALHTCTCIHHIMHLNKHMMGSRVKNLNPGDDRDDNANTFWIIIKSIYIYIHTAAVCMTKTQLYVVALLCRHVKVMTLNPDFPATSLRVVLLHIVASVTFYKQGSDGIVERG